jgi:DNA-binding IclR family transcriptional regulator
MEHFGFLACPTEHPVLDSLSSVEKAVDLLFHLQAAGEPRGVTSLGRALGAPKSSVHRLLAALARRGLVEREAGGRYRLGVGLASLALGALATEPVVLAARPVLAEEATAVGETVFLTAARGGRITVLDKVESAGLLRVAPRIGEPVPVHATAVGRLYLAFAPEEVVLGPPPFEAFTPRTPVSPEALEREVARAREAGFAESLEEWIPGLWALAVPLFAGSRMLGALVVGAAATRAEGLTREQVAERMLKAASRVAARLDGRPGATHRDGRPGEPRPRGPRRGGRS